MMASCAPIPLIDFFCEAVGAAIESGYQAVAAFDGTKVAVETISAGSAQRKGQKAIALAMEKQEEASRLSLEAEEYEGLYEEESEKIATEEAESETLSVRAGDAHLLSEEKMRESEKEETLAALDEGVGAICESYRIAHSSLIYYVYAYNRKQLNSMRKLLRMKL